MLTTYFAFSKMLIGSSWPHCAPIASLGNFIFPMLVDNRIAHNHQSVIM